MAERKWCQGRGNYRLWDVVGGHGERSFWDYVEFVVSEGFRSNSAAFNEGFIIDIP